MRVRGLTIVALALGIVLVAPGLARANTVTETVNTTFGSANVVSFWTNGPAAITGVSGLPSGWGFVGTTGTFGQIQTGFGTGTFTFSINYNDPGNAAFNVDIQNVLYDPALGTFGTEQGFTYSPTGPLTGSFGAGTYGNGGGPPGLQGPVPEPASLLVLGLGLAGYAWKRRRSARVAAG